MASAEPLGRDRELERVTSFLDDRGPWPRALLLHGEAGIGKTTVWQAAVDAAAVRRWRVVVTRPTEAEARVPFAGLNDLVGELVDAGDPDLPTPQRQALDIALMRAAPTDEPTQPLALSLAVLEVLRRSSASQPLLLGIDDSQWLDESTAGVVAFALRRLEGARVIAVVAERPTDTGQPSLVLRELPADRVVRVPIGALGLEVTDRLLDAALGLRLPPTTLRSVHEQAGGNPLHILELGRALKERGIDAGSIAELVGARVSMLPSEARAVLVAMSALAHPTTALLEAAVGREPARAGLAAARGAGVIAPGDDPLRTTHPTLASEAYGNLDDAARRDLHRRLAGAVSEPEERARHLALASTGPDAEVADALDAAAARALARGAPDAAADLSRLAADLTPAADVARARRMAAAGRYRLMAGDVARARELLERALGEPAAERGTGRAEVLYRLAGVRQLMDDFVVSMELGEEALRHAAEDPALTIRIKLLLAGSSYISGRSWASGAAHAFEAFALAEKSGDPQMVALTIGPFATWRYATGAGHDPELARRADELEPMTVQFRTLDLPQFDIGNIELQEGETARAVERLRLLLERAERDGDYSSLPFLLGNMGLGDFLEGRGDVARERLDRASRLAEATEQRVAQVHTRVWEARLAARLGDADRARRAGREALDLMASTAWRSGEWLMRADLAALALSVGDPSAALDAAAPALEPPAEDESDRRRWALAAVVEALVALGRGDEARAALAELDRLAERYPSPRLTAEVQRVRARLLAAEGDSAAAHAAIAEAEAIHRRIADPWELARTLLVSGELHRRARRRARARASLREALETFTFLGARLWATQAREQLGRIGASRPEGGLTPTQRTVADLVASGLTNRQVADRLFMSQHTVEAHLSTIYRAFDIHSRADLAKALATSETGAGDSGPST